MQPVESYKFGLNAVLIRINPPQALQRLRYEGATDEPLSYLTKALHENYPKITGLLIQRSYSCPEGMKITNWSLSDENGQYRVILFTNVTLYNG